MAASPTPEPTEPFWKRLFSSGEFAWTFRMRAGDAESFFAPQDKTGALLAEKRRWLDEMPELFLATTPSGESLVNTLWEMAITWGHVRNPENGGRDLMSLMRQWEPDVLLMDQETMAIAAGCVCMPSSWSLHHAVGKRVHDIHGMVPQLNPQIGEKIDRFLTQLQPEKAFCRENWSFTRTSDLNYHPQLKRRILDDSLNIDEVFLRVEHQLFTKISGGVLMGIRIENCPLTDIASDPEAWRNVAEKIRTMPDDIAAYKSMTTARSAIVREMEKFRPLSSERVSVGRDRPPGGPANGS